MSDIAIINKPRVNTGSLVTIENKNLSVFDAIKNKPLSTDNLNIGSVKNNSSAFSSPTKKIRTNEDTSLNILNSLEKEQGNLLTSNLSKLSEENRNSLIKFLNKQNQDDACQFVKMINTTSDKDELESLEKVLTPAHNKPSELKGFNNSFSGLSEAEQKAALKINNILTKNPLPDGYKKEIKAIIESLPDKGNAVGKALDEIGVYIPSVTLNAPGSEDTTPRIQKIF